VVSSNANRYFSHDYIYFSISIIVLLTFNTIVI